MTRDHIFSRSWNPDKSPTHQWTVAACQSCNNAFGKVEIALRDQLALGLAPNSPLAIAAIKMAVKNFNPASAKTEIDARARAKRQRQLFADAQFVFSPPPKGVMPFTVPNLQQEGYGIKRGRVKKALAERADFLLGKIEQSAIRWQRFA
jgi:hypothetical protein